MNHDVVMQRLAGEGSWGTKYSEGSNERECGEMERQARLRP